MTDALSDDAASVLDAWPEPALIVRPDGSLAHMNRRAAQLLAAGSTDRRADEWLGADVDQAQVYFQRCLGTAAPLLGTLTVRTPDGADRVQCRGARLATAAGATLLVRLTRTDEERFRALSTKVTELNEEITRRKHAEAILQETVRDKELVMRELQHRVKNNMQMLSGMLLGAVREARTPDAGSALRDAAARFSAVGAVQQLLYGSGELGVIDTEALVRTLLGGLKALAAQPLETSSRVDATELPVDTATPVALILNELLTNSLKYGRPAEGAQRVHVTFVKEGDGLLLRVEDNGPGFAVADQGRRASGLGLVRGLLRQLGGRLEVEADGGARCTATFAFPHPASRVVG